VRMQSHPLEKNLNINLGNFEYKFGQIWAKFGKFGQNLANLNEIWTDLGKIWAKVIKIWPNFIRFGQNRNLASPKTLDNFRLCHLRRIRDYGHALIIVDISKKYFAIIDIDNNK